MVSGVQSSLHPRVEATFSTDPATGNTATFGHGAKISSLERNNNIQKIWGLGSRGQTVSVETKFTGALSIDFLLSNSWIFFALMGAGKSTGGPTYTHTYTEQNTLPSYTMQNSLNIDPSGTNDMNVIFKGMVNTGATITSSVDAPVTVKMDWVYANEVYGKSAFIPQTAETFPPYSMGQASLQFLSGTTIANVQNVEFSLAQNAELIWGLGSRTATQKVEKQREYSLRSTIYLTDPTSFLAYVYSGTNAGTTPAAITEAATLIIPFSNGTNTITLSFTGIKIDTESLPQDPAAAVMEDIGIIARGLTVTATDTTATIPALWGADA